MREPKSLTVLLRRKPPEVFVVFVSIPPNRRRLRAVLSHVAVGSVLLASCRALDLGTPVEVLLGDRDGSSLRREVLTGVVECCMPLSAARGMDAWLVTCRLDRELTPEEVAAVRRRLPSVR
jgi:hypothetical protein